MHGHLGAVSANAMFFDARVPLLVINNGIFRGGLVEVPDAAPDALLVVGRAGIIVQVERAGIWIVETLAV